MSDSLFSDSAMRMARMALNGLSLRQQAISRNLANVDTPGYEAETINFEDTLKNIVNQDGSLSMETTSASHILPASQETTGYSVTHRQGGSFRADLNNVDIDVEMTDMSETGIQYQAVSQTISQKLMLLKALAK